MNAPPTQPTEDRRVESATIPVFQDHGEQPLSVPPPSEPASSRKAAIPTPLSHTPQVDSRDFVRLWIQPGLQNDHIPEVPDPAGRECVPPRRPGPGPARRRRPPTLPPRPGPGLLLPRDPGMDRGAGRHVGGAGRSSEQGPKGREKVLRSRSLQLSEALEKPRPSQTPPGIHRWMPSKRFPHA